MPSTDTTTVLCIPAVTLVRAAGVARAGPVQLPLADGGTVGGGRRRLLARPEGVDEDPSSPVPGMLQIELLPAGGRPRWPVASEVRALLRLEEGRPAPRLSARLRANSGWVTCPELELPGPGMYRFRSGVPALPRGAETASRWSRTIGALGGEEVFRRLAGLSAMVVGCGRSGSLAALDLARLGLRELFLVDDDIVELNTLGEAEGATPADCGRSKVEVLARHLTSLQLPARVVPLRHALNELRHRPEPAAADLLLLCVDDDRARLAGAVLATVHHRVLIDVATGIRMDAAGRRRAGADVRLILPGDGCLLCRGGLTALGPALASFHLPRRSSGHAAAWRRQRAGSLRTLNRIAVGVALQMLCDLVAERIERSTWLQLDLREDGRLSTLYPEPPNDPRCPLCAFAGAGCTFFLDG